MHRPYRTSHRWQTRATPLPVQNPHRLKYRAIVFLSVLELYLKDFLENDCSLQPVLAFAVMLLLERAIVAYLSQIHLAEYVMCELVALALCNQLNLVG